MEKSVKISRLIAEFMGYEVIPYQHGEYNPIYNGNKYAKTIGEQKALWNGLHLEFTGRFVANATYPFDTDFNYLVPVIRRIEEQGYVVCIAGIRYQVYKVLEENNPIVSLVCGDLSKKTEVTCDLITSFIEWYNQNQTQHETQKPH
jgi:hypothetical protein